MSTRTSKADANYFSVSNGTYQYFAGTDKVQSVDYPPSPLIFGTDANESWDTYVKVCDGTKGLQWAGLRAKQGNENSLDLNNRVENCQLAGDWGWGGGAGDQVITVKGGCHDISIGGVIWSRGNNADYVQDAWSDQSSDLCLGIDLGVLTRADGQPVTIILGRFGSKIAVYPPSYRVLWLKSWGYSLYWLGKRVAVKLGLIKGSK